MHCLSFSSNQITPSIHYYIASELSTSVHATMGAAPRGLLLVCAALMAIATANAASGEVSSVVVGLAKCADCTRKKMNAEAVFQGLKVTIKCKNSNGEYESMAVGELDGSGAFAVPLTADLHGSDCLAQLHSAAAGAPCSAQEPSRVVPVADRTFVAVAGKAQRLSTECASATISDPFDKKHLSDHSFDHEHHHFFDHFHKLTAPPTPVPEYHTPPTPMPEYHPPTMPTYGSPTPPIYHPPAQH
ncbi:hypothetical protein ACP70R_019826 [Stipagrostis hirtigluma subsp. patula]